MFAFNRKYFAIALLLLLVEVLIALFVHDKFIRPYVGDFLVVILLYCGLKTCIKLPVKPAALMVFLFAFSVETAQYFNLVGRLGLQDSEMAKIIFGSSFSWFDMLAYTLGVGVVIAVEEYRRGI
ncbi:MAG: DUF2809 domain-containing protein [Bacteroidia bacterium]